MKEILRNILRYLIPTNVIRENILFIIFLVLLVMFYIHNSYRVYNKAKELKKLNIKLQEKKTEYMTLNAKVGKRKKLSVLLKTLEKKNLKLLQQPPYKLEIPEKLYEKIKEDE